MSDDHLLFENMAKSFSRQKPLIDISKLSDKPPSYDEILAASDDYSRVFQKKLESILDENSKRTEPYYIIWKFKPNAVHKQIMDSIFHICDIELDPMLSLTQFKVDNKRGTFEVLWSLPFDAPQMVMDTGMHKMHHVHPMIARSVEKLKHSYIFTNPLKDQYTS